MAQNHNLTAHLTPIMYIDDDNDADIGQSWRKTGRECPYPVVVKTGSKYEWQNVGFGASNMAMLVATAWLWHMGSIAFLIISFKMD